MVKMLQRTNHGGKLYEVGKSYPVPKNVAERWIKNGIAEKDGNAPKQNQNTNPPPEPTFEEYLNSLSDDDLREFANKNGVVIPGNVSKRETIIDIILKNKQN